MLTYKSIALATALAFALAGCANWPSPGAPQAPVVIPPQVTSIEQEAFAYFCPIESVLGPFLPLAGPGGEVAFTVAQQICATGAITTAGAFLKEFQILEPAVVAYFESLTTPAAHAAADRVRALHSRALRYGF
jgi:hypothetical protein